MSEDIRPAKTLTGTVVSSKMDKTIAVLVKRTVKHPLYEKYHSKSTKLLAHDESNECSEGDTVVIESTRPLSKNKSWKLNRIVSKVEVV